MVAYCELFASSIPNAATTYTHMYTIRWVCIVLGFVSPHSRRRHSEVEKAFPAALSEDMIEQKLSDLSQKWVLNLLNVC